MEFVDWPNGKFQRQEFESFDPMDIACRRHVTHRLRHIGENTVAIGFGGYREAAANTDCRANQYFAISTSILILRLPSVKNINAPRKTYTAVGIYDLQMGNTTRPVRSLE